jgi:hypothetical protein
MEIKVYCAFDEMIPLNGFKPNPDNPNQHSSEQIDRLAKIIEHNGWRHPIIVSKQTGFVIVGHGRLLAAKKLKLKYAPVHYQDFRDTDEEYQFMVADNGISEWSDLDFSMINEKLKDIGPMDIELLGISNFMVDKSENNSQKDTVKKYVLQIEFADEQDMQKEYEELISKGLMVAIV